MDMGLIHGISSSAKNKIPIGRAAGTEVQSASVLATDGNGGGVYLPRILFCGWAAGESFNAWCHTTVRYSRRWKNTAVYGASQVQTTICSILFAITRVTPQNIGLWLWKALFGLH